MDDQGAGLRLPEGVACGPSGQVIVGDTGNDRLVRFTYQDKMVTGGSAIETTGALVAVPCPPELRRATSSCSTAPGGASSAWGRTATFKRPLVVPGRAAARAPSSPKDFAIDAADNIYVLDVFSAASSCSTPRARSSGRVPFPETSGSALSLAVDDAGGLLLLDSIRTAALLPPARTPRHSPTVGAALTGALATAAHAS